MQILALLAFMACSPGTIDTVQPGAVAKTALDGEWYWRRTVEEVPYGTAATFTGAQDELKRIRWEIQENLLLGYRSYPHVAADGADDSSAPILTFAIEDQFDIRRGYDRTTGEESNVIEENREAPWYDREFLRVDSVVTGKPFGRGLALAAFEFARQVLAFELLVLANVAGHHLFDLPGAQQLADPLAINPGVVRNKGQILDPRIADRIEQPFRQPAQAKPAARDQHAVLQQAIKRTGGIGINLLSHCSSPLVFSSAAR